MSQFDETNGEMRFIRHALGILQIPFQPQEWLHGKSWTAGNFTVSWGLRAVTDPPTLTHKDLPLAPQLPRELDLRLAAYRSLLQQADTLGFRDRVLLTAILNFALPDDPG